MALGFKKKNTPDNDIKKLSRAELLEMLIDQTRLADRLRIRNKRLTKELEVCKANLERSASLQIIMERLERIERIAAMHVGFTEEEIEELAAIGRPEPEEEPDELEDLEEAEEPEAAEGLEDMEAAPADSRPESAEAAEGSGEAEEELNANAAADM